MKTTDNRPARLFRGEQYRLIKTVKTGTGVSMPAGTIVIYQGGHCYKGKPVSGSKCCTVSFLNPQDNWPDIFHPLRALLGKINGR